MKQIRIALSGSGFKVPAHAGALQAIADAGYTPIQYAGTSGGSIVASLAACGMALADMKALALTQDWSSLLSFSPLALASGAWCSGDTLRAWLDEHTGGKTFADLHASLTVMASNIATMQPYTFSSDITPDAPVALAARASAAIPFIYARVPYKDASLYDGGLCNNIPVDQLVNDGTPQLGIQLVSNDTPLRSGDSLGPLTMASRLIDMMLSAQENAHISAAQRNGAHIAYVETGYASGLDTNMALATRQRLYDDGYQATQAVLAGFPA